MTAYQVARRASIFGLAAALALTIGACERAETADIDLEGVWQSRGYGLIIENEGDRSRRIEYTPVSCLLDSDRSIERLVASLAGTPDPADGMFATGSRFALSTKVFDRLEEGGFERLCPNGLTEETDDPELNFEVLWQTFDQHYAFFEERDVDWDAVYAEFRPKVTKDTSSRELGRLLDRMLEKLKDAHVGLVVDGDDVVSVASRLDLRLADECRRGADCDIDDYVDDQYQAFGDIIKNVYLDDDVETGLNGRAWWGQIDDDTGYFRISAMAGFVRGDYSAASDLAAVETALDAMLDDIGDLPTMIVDVRLNGGGHDTVAVAIANRFTEKRRVFGSKRAYFDGSETAATDLVIEPAEGRRFEGEVAVLTSDITASAAEIFTMAMRAIPHATLVGAATEGILSDQLYRSLPNGWWFSLSNEIYLTQDGILFEKLGVAPDIEVPFLLPEDLEDDVDRGIDTALTLLADHAEAETRSH
jgi:hypothetical protein